MSVTKDEKATVAILRDGAFPIGVVEGSFKGERRVFICLMERDKKGKVSVGAPLALLLDEKDFPNIKNSEGAEPGAPKIEIVGG